MKYSQIIFLLALSCFLACSLFDQDPAPFSLQIIPQSMEAIAGQRCVLLITFQDEGKGKEEGKAVVLTATAADCDIVYENKTLAKNKVAEITIIPSQAAVIGDLNVVVTGERAGLKKSKQMTIQIVSGTDNILQSAAEIRDRFVQWLASAHPELSITPESQWTNTIVTPNILIVSNYLFFSRQWEMGLTWHVMIAPHDWARIYLRRRFEQDNPSLAFEISSLSVTDPPHSMEVPDEVIR